MQEIENNTIDVEKCHNKYISKCTLAPTPRAPSSKCAWSGAEVAKKWRRRGEGGGGGAQSS